MATFDTANLPTEYPDIVGARPTNPLAANFKPFIPPSVQVPELTLPHLITGTFLGMIFGASSLYLVLKVGLTVSASIPVAVISITIFRIFSKVGFRDANVLQNNIVQTAGSAGESIAFGLGVTMPAIMILGFDLEIARVMLVAILGGLLGILMMIPLRRALIVAEHGILKYPEGTACAEVLKAAASKESLAVADKTHTTASAEIVNQEAASGGKVIFSGFGIGFLYQAAMGAFKMWKDTPQKIFGAPFKGGSISATIEPALLGVGYIIGPRIGSIMCAGGVLSYLVLIPAIKFFGDGLTTVLPPETGGKLISQMGPDDIRGAYILYIGAGAVAAGGIISLFRSIPTIWHGLRGGLADLLGHHGPREHAPRTDRDLSMRVVIIGCLAIIAIIMAVPQLNLRGNLLGALLIVLFGFLFVTVSSRLTGEIGSSSNPISGMTVATLLLTCLVFLIVGWTGPHYFVTALSIGGIVCIAASNGGTTSQDLKTGFLVGSTPKFQQIAILFGALASALTLGSVLLFLNNAYTVYVPAATFTEVVNRVPSPAGVPLQPFDEKGKPNGSFRLLTVTPDTPAANLEPGEYLVGEDDKVSYKIDSNFPPHLRAPPNEIGRQEKLRGLQGVSDQHTYRAWQRADPAGGDAQRYLVNEKGVPVYLVDPGINGKHKTRPDRSSVMKFDAPKATLMSYIIKGILSRKLPWALVLLGAMIAIVLEMSGLPSLAFAVGVYLPLASSSPIFVGGMIRWLVDRYLRIKFRHRNLSEIELTAEGDKSPGVLLASGYIAGGAITGIVIAAKELVGPLAAMGRRIEDWQSAHNPFFNGAYSDLLALVPFLVLCVLLYLVGRDVLLRPSKATTTR
jgi:putative OPT family oligopeptide transporter